MAGPSMLGTAQDWMAGPGCAWCACVGNRHEQTPKRVVARQALLHLAQGRPATSAPDAMVNTCTVPAPSPAGMSGPPPPPPLPPSSPS
eukprot:365628-Chlamydomonas_euryale.AAC.3